MKQKILMTLALLLTAVTGAWAQETATITLTSGQTVKTYEDVTLPWSTTAEILKEVVTDINFNININAISGGDGKVVKYGNENFTVTGTFSGEAKVTVTYNTGSSATITVTAPAPLIALDETKTVATMAAMPAYDATVSYELVRDLGTGVGVKVNGNQTWGETAASILVKKENGEYPAASTLEVALTDVLESNATIESSNYTWKLQRLADDGQTWTDLTLAEAKLSPGTYCIVATAADGTPYDGECDGEFTIYENYDLTLSPATDANLKSVTVAGTAKTADEKGVIKNIEPGKKVKITTTGPDYIIRKAAVKKTENMKTLQIGGETTATIYYIEGESWTDAITNHPTENAGWKAFSNQITYDGSAYVLFYGGSTTKVNPGEEIDSTKTYKLES